MNKHYQITVLVENTATGRGLLGEHGLSYLIEVDEQKIIFDTGQGLALPHNAKQLGIDLNYLDAIALSHGHFDHSGGLISLLEQGQKPRLFLHPDAVEAKYSSRGEIGLNNADPEWLRQQVRELIWTETPTEIIPGVYLTGTIPRNHPLENTGGLFWQNASHTKFDRLLDDQALFMEVQEGWVVVLGCAHSGVINTLDYIAKITGTRKFYAVIGGMHLLNAKGDRLQATAEAFARYDVQVLGANHCTGMKALSFLWNYFPDRCVSCNVGTRFQFGPKILPQAC